MKIKKSLVAIALLLLCAVSASQAASVYTYVGPNYNTFTSGLLPNPFDPPLYNNSMHISATLTLLTPLAANLPLTDITARVSPPALPFGPPQQEHFEIFDGREGYSIKAISFAPIPELLMVATDANGNINQWKFSSSNDSIQLRSRSTSHVQSLNTGSEGPADSAGHNESSLCCFSRFENASVNAVGAWTHVVPLPGGLPLLLPALAVVGLWRRRCAA